MSAIKCISMVLGAAILFASPAAYAKTKAPVIPRQVSATGTTTFRIHRGGYDQYRGQLSFGKVKVYDPPHYKVPKGFTNQIAMFKAQVEHACIQEWVKAKTPQGVPANPAFVIYDELQPNQNQSGMRKLSINKFTIDSHGNWVADGFDSNDPNRVVLALGGFWDTNYNYEVPPPAATIKFMGTKVYISCLDDVRRTTVYPKTDAN